MHMPYAYGICIFHKFARIGGFLFRKSSYGATWSQEGYKIDEIIKHIEKNKHFGCQCSSIVLPWPIEVLRGVRTIFDQCCESIGLYCFLMIGGHWLPPQIPQSFQCRYAGFCHPLILHSVQMTPTRLDCCCMAVVRRAFVDWWQRVTSYCFACIRATTKGRVLTAVAIPPISVSCRGRLHSSAPPWGAQN